MKLNSFGLIAALFFLFLACNSVTAVENVTTTPIREPSFIAQVVVYLVKYWIYITVGFFALLMAVFIILLIRSMGKKIDPFKEEYKKTKRLCKYHASAVSKEVYAVAEGKLQNLGHYMGECITQDGYLNIMLWKFKKWYLFWVPSKLDFFDLVKEIFVLKCNINKSYKEKVIDQVTKEESIKVHELATNLVSKDGDKVLIKCFGIEPTNYFFYPVLKTADGNIANSMLETFEREKEPALINTLYTLSEDFANIARELININPRVRYEQKTGENIEQKR